MHACSPSQSQSKPDEPDTRTANDCIPVSRRTSIRRRAQCAQHTTYGIVAIHVHTNNPPGRCAKASAGGPTATRVKMRAPVSAISPASPAQLPRTAKRTTRGKPRARGRDRPGMALPVRSMPAGPQVLGARTEVPISNILQAPRPSEAIQPRARPCPRSSSAVLLMGRTILTKRSTAFSPIRNPQPMENRLWAVGGGVGWGVAQRSTCAGLPRLSRAHQSGRLGVEGPFSPHVRPRALSRALSLSLSLPWQARSLGRATRNGP